MICPPDCSCLLCQLAIPAEIGCSSRVADASPLDDGNRRTSRVLDNSEPRARREFFRESDPVESILRRVNLKPGRKVVQTGRRKPR